MRTGGETINNGKTILIKGEILMTGTMRAYTNRNRLPELNGGFRYLVRARDVLVKVHYCYHGTDSGHIYPWEHMLRKVSGSLVFGHNLEILSKSGLVTEFKSDRVAGETHIPYNHCSMCLFRQSPQL